MSHVFLSYARHDRAFVDRLIAALERNGFDAWVDRQDIAGGSAWEATISEAVRSSAAVVVVLSPAVAASEYVPRELSIADKYDRPVIPVRLQPWEAAAHETEQGRRLEFQLAGVHYVDFAHRPFDAALADLLSALRRVEGGGVDRPFPARLPASGPRRRRVLAVAAGLAAVALAGGLVWRRRGGAPEIAGVWHGEVAYPWGARVTERFRFSVDGDTLSGTASFLGAPRGILDGRLAGERFTFRTVIEGGPGTPAFSNAYRGRLVGDALHLLVQDDRGNPPVELVAERTK